MSPVYHVARSIRIEVSPEELFPHLVDLRRWHEWSPWEGEDTHIKRGYSRRQGEPGATYTWDGHKAGPRDASQGWLRVTRVEPGRSVDLDVHIDQPFPADTGLRLDVDPEDDGRAAKVTWTMTGQPPRLLRLLRRVLPMEKFVGQDCEQGLAALKNVLEGRHRAA